MRGHSLWVFSLAWEVSEPLLRLLLARVLFLEGGSPSEGVFPLAMWAVGVGGRVFTGGVTGFTVTLFPFSTFFAFVFAFSFGGFGGALALVLGFAAVAAADVSHENDPAFFCGGSRTKRRFVIFGPAGVSSLNIARVGSAAGDADAFAITSVAQAEGVALCAEVV